MITCKVTLIEGVFDTTFEFDTYKEASEFVGMALANYVPTETDHGMSTLVIEIEMLNNEPF